MYNLDLEVRKFGRFSEVLLRLSTLISLYNFLSPKIYGEFLKRTLEELGCVFVKFGQLLTYQPKLNKQIAEELEKLMYKVKPFDIKIAERVVEEKIGRCKLKRIATASLAQVHVDDKGRAVKVRKPGIVDEVILDLEILNSVPISMSLFKSTVELLNVCLIEEIDFRKEASNMMEFEFQSVKIPEVHDYCEDVLITDFAKGYNALELDKVDAIARKRAFKAIVNCIVESVEMGKLHGDPSFGNVIVDREGNVTLIDFGVVWKANERQKRVVEELYLSLLMGDFDNVKSILNNEILKTEIDVDIKGDLGKLLFSNNNFVDRMFEEGVKKNAEVDMDYLVFVKSLIQWLKLSKKVLGRAPREEDIINAKIF